MCLFIEPGRPGEQAAAPSPSTRSPRLKGAGRYRHRMRPFTAIVVAGLLVLIVGAFVAKLMVTGLTP